MNKPGIELKRKEADSLLRSAEKNLSLALDAKELKRFAPKILLNMPGKHTGLF
jgi:hypothetical protein